MKTAGEWVGWLGLGLNIGCESKVSLKMTLVDTTFPGAQPSKAHSALEDQREEPRLGLAILACHIALARGICH